MKPIYFLSDAHLGSLAIQSRRMQERRLVRFLDSIKHKAGAVYLLGDMFDFWHEYKTVVSQRFHPILGQNLRTHRPWRRSTLFYGQS